MLQRVTEDPIRYRRLSTSHPSSGPVGNHRVLLSEAPNARPAPRQGSPYRLQEVRVRLLRPSGIDGEVVTS